MSDVGNRHAVSTRPQASLRSVRQLVIDTLPPAISSAGGEVIFGAGSELDSLGLVNFLADLEYRVAQDFGCEVVLASEQAMSRSRSPFRDADALAAYIMELLAV